MKTVKNAVNGEILFHVADDNYQAQEGEILVDFVPDVDSALDIQNNLLNNEFEKYLKRKSDGESCYLKLSAELRLSKLSGQITEEYHSSLETILTPFRNELMCGQWVTGLKFLELIVGQLEEELYLKIHNQITMYINENY